MTTKLTPAVLTFDAAGTPFSNVYGDIYHSAESGPGQARHVFLGGNDLPGKWAGARLYTIVETGFGVGLNFLATWQAWRTDPARPEHLHFLSVEKHPFPRDALMAIHLRYSEFSALAAQLHALWPLVIPGTHRLHFEDGRVTLTLVFADADATLPGLRLRADAFFLDGFAPTRNAELWTPRLMKALARLACAGATLATYTTARTVREALTEAGFAVAKRPGFGRKREMLAARFAPRWTPRHTPTAAPVWQHRRAIVVGAGLAGAAVSERLSAHGWHVDIIERNTVPATGTSGLHAAAFHPLLSRDDSITARLTRAGFLYAIDRWSALENAGHAFEWRCCGVLQIARDAHAEMRMAQTISAHGYPCGYAQYADAATAAVRAGCRMPHGGLWFPQGGWIKPASLIAAQLDASRLAVHFGRNVHALKFDGELWRALAFDGSVIATAPVVVLANAGDAAQLVNIGQPLQRIRGQLTHMPAAAVPALRAVVTGAVYVLPAIDGIVVTGASYDFNDHDPAPHAAGHAGNLEQLAQLLNVSGVSAGAAALGGSVGFRCVAPDRMPLIGALPDIAAARARGADLLGAHAEDLPRIKGLYGAFGYASRGLAWAALGAEHIASMLDGEPAPIEHDLANAIDPARFVLKRARAGSDFLL